MNLGASLIIVAMIVGALSMALILPAFTRSSGEREMEEVLFSETGTHYSCWYYEDTPPWAYGHMDRYNVLYSHLDNGTVVKYSVKGWGNLNCIKG